MKYYTEQISYKEILEVLKQIDLSILPEPLSKRVNLEEYSKKLEKKSTHFICRNNDTSIIGMLCCYLNDRINYQAYISMICVLQPFVNKGIGKNLLMHCITEAKNQRFKSIKLEINKENKPSIIFHKKQGFIIQNEDKESFYLIKNI